MQRIFLLTSVFLLLACSIAAEENLDAIKRDLLELKRRVQQTYRSLCPDTIEPFDLSGIQKTSAIGLSAYGGQSNLALIGRPVTTQSDRIAA